MNKIEKDIRNNVAAIQRCMGKISRQRNILRALHSETDELLCDLEYADDDVTQALRTIEGAIDSLSKSL